MTEQEQVSMDSWDGLIETYLKPQHIKEFPGRVFVAGGKAGYNRRGEPQLVYKVHYDGHKFSWDANKTNMKKLRELGIAIPKDLINKSVWFEKVQVRNPSTGKTVDSLDVKKVE